LVFGDQSVSPMLALYDRAPVVVAVVVTVGTRGWSFGRGPGVTSGVAGTPGTVVREAA